MLSHPTKRKQEEPHKPFKRTRSNLQNNRRNSDPETSSSSAGGPMVSSKSAMNLQQLEAPTLTTEKDPSKYQTLGFKPILHALEHTRGLSSPSFLIYQNIGTPVLNLKLKTNIDLKKPRTLRDYDLKAYLSIPIIPLLKNEERFDNKSAPTRLLGEFRPTKKKIPIPFLEHGYDKFGLFLMPPPQDGKSYQDSDMTHLRLYEDKGELFYYLSGAKHKIPETELEKENNEAIIKLFTAPSIEKNILDSLLEGSRSREAIEALLNITSERDHTRYGEKRITLYRSLKKITFVVLLLSDGALETFIGPAQSGAHHIFVAAFSPCVVAAGDLLFEEQEDKTIVLTYIDTRTGAFPSFTAQGIYDESIKKGIAQALGVDPRLITLYNPQQVVVAAESTSSSTSSTAHIAMRLGGLVISTAPAPLSLLPSITEGVEKTAEPITPVALQTNVCDLDLAPAVQSLPKQTVF